MEETKIALTKSGYEKTEKELKNTISLILEANPSIDASKYDINKLVSQLDFESNKLQKVNDNLVLTKYQIDVLTRNGIDLQTVASLHDIIYEAEEVYEDTLDEELEQVLDELSERNYYENTNK